MFGRKKGTWIQFDSKNPKARVTTLGASCISTSAEAAGHLRSVISSGKIVSVNDRIRETHQNSLAEPEPAQA